MGDSGAAMNSQVMVRRERSAWASRAAAPADFDEVKFEEDFGFFLIAEKIIDQIVLERAGGAARKTGERLDRVLTKLGLIPEASLAVALSRFLSLELARPADVPL